MNTNMNTVAGGASDLADSRACSHAAIAGERIPLLELRVFGGFDAQLDGRPIDSASTRQRRIQTLLGILTINHGHELYCDHLADSIWPRSSDDKKRHCFYNLWYLATHAVWPGKKGTDNPYFERRQRTCRLLDKYVRTDIEVVDQACCDLVRRDIDPAAALDAYRRLQVAYRGDLLPGEMENVIVRRARVDWRERVCDALSTVALTMAEQGEDRTALWMASAACRLSEMREDIVRLRMELFAKMGMRASAVRVFYDYQDYLHKEMGVRPSPQSFQLMQKVVETDDLEFTFAPVLSGRRRMPGNTNAPEAYRGDAERKTRTAPDDVLPAEYGAAHRHM